MGKKQLKTKLLAFRIHLTVPPCLLSLVSPSRNGVLRLKCDFSFCFSPMLLVGHIVGPQMSVEWLSGREEEIPDMPIVMSV